MELTLTLGRAAALFGAMLVLAVLPSVSVMTVVARSAAHGVRHGCLTAAGIVLGDLVLMLVALLGLALVAETLGGFFTFLRYAGAAYLIWTGYRLWRQPPAAVRTVAATRASGLSSLLTGLAITLGDQKAIVFYLAFFPAFLDLTVLTRADLGVIVLITVVAVGGAKCGYALLAGRVGALVNPRVGRVLGRSAAVLLVAAGLAVALSG